MTNIAHDRAAWLQAQEAEKGHWATLWQSEDSQERIALINGETTKAEYIFQEMVDHLGIKPARDWAQLRVLDVGCGPLSVIAHHRYGQTREGVDPLKYPTWVYEAYEARDFAVHLTPFEDFTSTTTYDVVVFYNALQHFASLEAVARKCQEILAPEGTVLLCEYLKVPTNEAHIQYLEADRLDQMFAGQGFKVTSNVLSVRLPGFVERPGGEPIDLYVAKISR